MVAEARTVQQALAAVISEMPAIGKDDHSTEGFNFRGIEAMTRAIQPLLARHGIVIVPSSKIVNVVPSPAMKDGWQDVYVEVDWAIYGPDGSSISARTNGVGRDRVDRGGSKAATQAYKYLLLHMLCVSDAADEGDRQSYEKDRVVTPRAMNKAQAKNHLKATLGQEKAAAVWKGMALDNAMPWSVESLDEAARDFDSQAEPFDDPVGPVTIPQVVDRDTGEVLVPEQTIHPQPEVAS